jgi:hypothetical protein
MTNFDEVLARLDDAFSGRRCVSAWLGYGEPLLLGLGEHVLPEWDNDGHHPLPPFELETNFADWSVEQAGACVSSRAERSAVEAATMPLIGQRVVAWQLRENNGLRICFEAGNVLFINPWPAEAEISDAWSITFPDGKIVAVATDGNSVIVDKRRPISEWFE